MEFEIPIATDDDGYLRRECPRCLSEFKWHHGPVGEWHEAQTEASIYFCPLCGVPAPIDQWWTPAQLDYARAVAEAHASEVFQDELRKSGLTSSKSGIRIEISGNGPAKLPTPPVEPNDMDVITSPCHPNEPVKVPDDNDGHFFCLVCGYEYVEV